MITLIASVSAIAQCRQIEAEAKVIKSSSGNGTSSIVLEYKDNRGVDKFQVNLFGPNRKNQLNVEKTSFENLEAGKYLIVIVAKKEGDNYCPKSINVTVN
jgi:hypothetical protein